MIHYSFRDQTGKAHNIRFGLYKDSRLPTGLFLNYAEAFGLYPPGELQDVEKNPVFAANIDWEKECGIDEILITARSAPSPAGA